MSIPLRLGAANYWIRDKVLFSAHSLCALKADCGVKKKRRKKSGPILGAERATGVRNRSSGKPLFGWGDFEVRPDLSHLPGFFCRKGSGTTGCCQTLTGKGEEGKERESRKDPERVKKTERGKTELPLPHTGNINPFFSLFFF